MTAQCCSYFCYSYLILTVNLRPTERQAQYPLQAFFDSQTEAPNTSKLSVDTLSLRDHEEAILGKKKKKSDKGMFLLFIILQGQQIIH